MVRDDVLKVGMIGVDRMARLYVVKRIASDTKNSIFRVEMSRICSLHYLVC